jgi:DnaJ-domain-containing protein 1
VRAVDIPDLDQVWREDALVYLTTRYERAFQVLRDPQWDTFRGFVDTWLDSFDWRTPERLARYLALSEEQRRQRFERFLVQADSWDVTLQHPVEERPSAAAQERRAWHAAYERSKAASEQRLREAAEAWQRVREYLENEQRLRHMPEGLREAYRLLGLPPTSALADARKRYRELAKKLHPDRGGDPAHMARLNEAWAEVLEFFLTD